MSKDTDHKESKKSGGKVLMIIVAFFATFMIVDAYFVYKAVTTHTGTVSDNAYKQGLNFNAIIAEAKKREQDRNSAEQ